MTFLTKVERSYKPNFLKVLLLSICLLSGITGINAQTPAVFEDPGGETGGDGNGGFGDGPVVPFDGGMSCLLLASAICYGSKKFRNGSLSNL